MHVAIVSGLLSESYGGPPAVVRAHVAALSGRADVTVFGVAASQDLPAVRADLPDVLAFPPTWPKRWFRGKGLFASLQSHIRSYDVVHAHMLWDHSVWAAARVAQGAHVPLVVTPHGSLSDIWRYRSLHKRVY